MKLGYKIARRVIEEIRMATPEERAELVVALQDGMERNGRRTVNTFLRLFADKIEGGELEGTFIEYLDRLENKPDA